MLRLADVQCAVLLTRSVSCVHVARRLIETYFVSSLAPKTNSASCMQVLEDPKLSRTSEYPSACLIGSVGNATPRSL